MEQKEYEEEVRIQSEYGNNPFDKIDVQKRNKQLDVNEVKYLKDTKQITSLENMNELIDANPNVCVIATGMPSALNKLTKVENAILLYSYYEANFESLCKVLNNEVN